MLAVERLLFRACGVDPAHDQSWKAYLGSLLAFSAFGLGVVYALLRLQHALPIDPQHFAGVHPALAFNTAASFVTNTDWQSYGGESTMSNLSQMAALGWQNFVSAAAGLGLAMAVARGATRQHLGNFWVDLLRGTFFVLLPIALCATVFFLSQGVVQTLAPFVEAHTLEGGKQLIALGPVASQEAIKQLGTNGGGFFNANSAHPFENPTPLTNFVQLLLVFSIPAALTYTFGRMCKDQRQGWALFAAMSVLFLGGVSLAYAAESHGTAALASSVGNLEGKETRFGVASSALFATVTTDASCGAVSSMHESMTALGGLVPLVNIQLGEIVFGGVGAGLYGMLVFVLLTVFIAGLMVGRTPEYLGKKIEAREMTLAMLYILVFPLCVLGLSAWAAVAPYALSSLASSGPHGLTALLYAYTSGTGNNGSAFAGLAADTPFWNWTLGVTMLVGRFAMIAPALAIAGSLAAKKTVPPGPGTFPTGSLLFVGLLVALILVVGALTFFPALALGPIVEHFMSIRGQVL